MATVTPRLLTDSNLSIEVRVQLTLALHPARVETIKRKEVRFKISTEADVGMLLKEVTDTCRPRLRRPHNEEVRKWPGIRVGRIGARVVHHFTVIFHSSIPRSGAVLTFASNDRTLLLAAHPPSQIVSHWNCGADLAEGGFERQSINCAA